MNEPARSPHASPYGEIRIGGGDTAEPLSIAARLRLIERFAALPGQRVIDCGCGSGGYVLEFLKRGADAVGVEHSAEKVEEYKRRAEAPARVTRGNLEELEFPSGHFDLALLNEVLEHVPDDLAALREIFRVLKPGGALVIFSPNRLYPFETHGLVWRSSGKMIAPVRTFLTPYLPVRAGRRVFDYPARNYFPSDLRSMARRAGFVIEGTSYLWQTFEDISGRQPRWMRGLRPALRGLCRVLERTPVLRAFGVSQVLFLRRPSRRVSTSPAAAPQRGASPASRAP
jgi:ubiquinone/menaquinone biosynthesis C-methylase UbiE